MSESNALFGTDGTQLPDPLPVLPDALTGLDRGTWRNSSTTVPDVPQTRAMQEVITAAFVGNSTGHPPVDTVAQQPGAVGPGAVGSQPGAVARQSGVVGHQSGVVARQFSAPRPWGEPAGSSAPEFPSSAAQLPGSEPPGDRSARVQELPPATLPSRSNVGLIVVSFLVLIIFLVIVFNIISGIVSSF